MKLSIQRLLPAVLIPLVLVTVMSIFSCSEKSTTETKASSSLLAQVALRQEQLAHPTAERLAEMQEMGMSTDNIGVQRIYIHLNRQLTAAQADELTALGITLYMDSWVPPTGEHSTGFILADTPVAKLDALAAKDFVISLDTAEGKAEPQPAMPQ